MPITVYVIKEASLSVIGEDTRNEFIKDAGLGSPIITGYDTNRRREFFLFQGGEADLEGLGERLKKYPFFESAEIRQK